MQGYFLVLVVFTCLIVQGADAFALHGKRILHPASLIRPTPSAIAVRPPSKTNLHMSNGLFVADGLDEAAVQALGQIEDADVGALVDSAQSPIIGIVTKIASNPNFIFVPIVVGFGLAFAIGYFIYSWSLGSED